MQPYVIKQGDFLAKLAHRFQFDGDSVWNDPANDDLRKVRSDSNALLPTDILYIPDQTGKEPAWFDLAVGSTRVFTSDPPEVDIGLRFVDSDCASQSITVDEYPHLEGLKTDDQGKVTISVPVTTELITVTFGELAKSFAFVIGHLDPIETPTGVFQRLQNLGYIPSAATFDPQELSSLDSAVLAFRRAQGAADAADGIQDSDDTESSDDAGDTHDSDDMSATCEWNVSPNVPDEFGNYDYDEILDESPTSAADTAIASAAKDDTSGAKPSDRSWSLDPDASDLLRKIHGC